jgi:tripartite-type tricarboxylate transporter receptor subunit TctC
MEHPMGRQVQGLAIGALALLALIAGAAPPVLAESYPTKPVKIITQAPAGSGPDVILRIVAGGLTQVWGQQVLGINRPGGGGLVAAQAAATTPERDGYTLYMASASAMVVLPETQAKLPFSFDRDFVSIGLVGEQPFVIAVPPALKIGTLAELIALARQRPGAISYAANTTGTLPHLTGEFFRRRSGIDATFVPYAGGAPAALNDIMGGRISMIVDALPALSGAIQGGILKALAVTSHRRLPQYPDLPTVSETLPGFEATGWFALMAPAGTADTIIRKASSDLGAVLRQPELQERLATLGTYTRPLSPEGLAGFILAEQRLWKPIVKEVGLGTQ